MSDIGARSLARRLRSSLGGTERSFCAGATVHTAGDPAQTVALVAAGLLRSVQVTPDGRRFVSRFVWPDALAGLCYGRTHRADLEAVTPSRIVLFSAPAVRALIRSDPEAWDAFAETMADYLDEVAALQLRLSRLNAHERVADFLAQIVKREGAAPGARHDLPMSRLDIGDHLGLTLETVSRELHALRREGVLDLQGAHQFQVLRPEALDEAAGRSDPARGRLSLCATSKRVGERASNVGAEGARP